MQIYVVGGAVRDRLLGLPVQDRDYVVVGADPQTMLAQGFKPVGKDFPVFLHPQTHEEYALARTERKTGRGYAGFAFHAAPDVTLEQDLARRDLTINAIAEGEDGSLTDPYGGVRDIAARVLRHVGPAFVEDPVRILRLARFSARFTDFSVAPETLALMREMVANGEVDALVPERVWQELAKGLMEARPSRMFAVLKDCGALARLLPELEKLDGVPQRADYHPEIDTFDHVMRVIDVAASRGEPLPVRFAALLHDLGKGTTPADILPRHIGHEHRSVELGAALCARLKVPVECRDLALLTARYHGDIHKCLEMRPATLVTLLEKTDAFRRPERFEQLLAACACDYNGRKDWEERPYASPARLRTALAAARSVDAGAVAKAAGDRSRIPDAIHQARAGAVAAALRENG
ncbi:multifunctional CCA addition/repair protein [Azospira oryzae]|uniref:multifunctional CCA addition/repair protein n=1 Tax=Azospira oryzae TaxID=146939 RepID=UPI001964B40A|nr:multifunctional CCA addition/repair protein [Azospira oryzae]